nr:MAG: putative maturation protein [Leviviridae sp.]
MTARSRIIGEPLPQGGYATRKIGSNPPTEETQYPLGLVSRDRCDDIIGNPNNDNPLLIDKYKMDLRLMNGQEIGPGDSYKIYTSWIPTYFLTPSSRAQHASITGLPSAASDAIRLRAMTNPGRAEVSLPVFIGEARDLPHMIKSAGDSLLKRRKYWFRNSAGQYLSWEFGWKPLMNDLRKIVTFQSSVDSRVKELERLYSKGGLKRRMKLGHWGAVEQLNNRFIESSLGTVIQARETRFTQVERWGTIRWKPTTLPKSIDRPELQRQAIKAVFGLSLQAEDVWNLVPWTWLIDWFTNAGDFLEAHGNRIPALPGPANIMTKSESVIRWDRTTAPNWVKWERSSMDYVTKERYVGSGSLSATLPFLSGRQMSILSALAVTRAKGSSRYRG